MGVFACLAALVSIVVGRGLTRLLVSINRVIHARDRARVYRAQLVRVTGMTIQTLGPVAAD